MGQVTGVLDWAVAAQTLRGQTESGDLHLVAPFEGGVLAAVIDGLGHGPDAAEAARAACTLLAQDPARSPARLLQRCHENLRRTRGVVMSLASFTATPPAVAWAGVGDVEAMLLRADPKAKPAREAIVLRSGVVGYQLPPLRESRHLVAVGDVLILATDGISQDFAASADRDDDPQAIADAVLAGHAKGTDDALVLVARYRGAVP